MREKIKTLYILQSSYCSFILSIIIFDVKIVLANGVKQIHPPIDTSEIADIELTAEEWQWLSEHPVAC